MSGSGKSERQSAAVPVGETGGDKNCCPCAPKKGATLDVETMSYAGAGDIDGLYRSIQRYPDLLQDLDAFHFVHTPLHVAAEWDQANFAVEIMNLMPSLGKKLNPQGLSPLHLAVETNSIRTAKALIKLNPQLIRVKGKGGLTPLHHAAMKDDRLDLLASFLFKCPDAIKDLTGRFQTAVHVALENNSFKAFLLLLGWMRRKQNDNPVIGWKDEDGNTALHLAVLRHDTCGVQALKEMVSNISILDKKNSAGKTPLDIAEDQGNVEMQRILIRAGARTSEKMFEKKRLSDYLMSPPTISEILSRDNSMIRKKLAKKSDVLIVVAVLVATATYQAALQPPGGLYQASAEAVRIRKAAYPGKMVMPQRESNGFVVANTWAFMLSMFVIIKVAYSSVGHIYFPLKLSLFFVACSYVVGLKFIAETSSVSLLTWVLSLCFIIWAHLTTLVEELEAIVAGIRPVYCHVLHHMLKKAFAKRSSITRRQNKINWR